VSSKKSDGSGSSSIAGWLLWSVLLHEYNTIELSMVASWHRRLVNASHLLSTCFFVVAGSWHRRLVNASHLLSTCLFFVAGRGASRISGKRVYWPKSVPWIGWLPLCWALAVMVPLLGTIVGEIGMLDD